jgi:exosortase
MPVSNLTSLFGAPWLVILAVIWAPVVYLLGAQWSLVEEYQYGWAVPLMCVYLAAQRVAALPPATVPARKKTAVILLAAAALFYWVMRILQEANPLWRAASYGLALAAVAMTLLVIYLTQGGGRLRHLIFPVAFFLVAVPWPTPVELGIIQRLTGFNTGLAVEALNCAGVPALQLGNVIEISAGEVGISEACSGIRSFQATLMIALFFGEFYRLSTSRRWRLLAAGPLLAMAFNLLRTLILVFIAAFAGLPVMEKWHDRTGEALLISCFLCLWSVAIFLKKKDPQPPANFPETPLLPAVPLLRPLTWLLVVWAVATEISTEAWFRSHEKPENKIFSWAVRWPQANPTLQTNVISQSSLEILQCDQNSSATWIEEGGVSWRAFFLRWLPSDSFYGRAKEALSKAHNPTVCLPASGIELRARLEPVSLRVHPGLTLAFDRYVFTAGGRDLFVFFSQTEDTLESSAAIARRTHLARLDAALAGSRNYGQNNFEAALMGPENAEAALRIFSARLPELIKIQPVAP